MSYFGRNDIYKDKNPFENIPVELTVYSITNTFYQPHEVSVTGPKLFCFVRCFLWWLDCSVNNSISCTEGISVQMKQNSEKQTLEE
jgi:hypothetical protein